MAEERLALAELLEKAGDGDFLRTVAEAVLQLLMEADVDFGVDITGFSIAEVDQLIEGLTPSEPGDPPGIGPAPSPPNDPTRFRGDARPPPTRP